MAGDLEALKACIGRKEAATDVVTASQVGKLAVTLDVDHPAPNEGDAVPFGWHGGFCPGLYRKAQMRADGQAAGVGVAPAVPLPRRRLIETVSRFHDPLRIGDAITKTTEVAAVDIADFGTGPTVKVTMRESYATTRGLAAVDERSVLYFGLNGPGRLDPPPSPPADPAWTQTFEPDPVTIWRLCAQRFNSHRIHFDRDYTTKVEGYAGVVVPVTLISQIMMEMCRQRHERPLRSFTYRSIEIVVDTGPFTILGGPDASGGVARLWCTNAEGRNALVAEAAFS